jgi:polyketide cyclase/dehydrase/lipid transport protein
MPSLTNTIEIAADHEAVFAFVSDLRNETRWNPDCRAVTKLSDGPIGLGARYRASWKGSPELIVECVAYDAPRSWTNTNGGPISITSTFTITPTATGSTLTSVFVIEPHGLGVAFAPLFRQKMSRAIPRHLATIKALLEGRAAAAPQGTGAIGA